MQDKLSPEIFLKELREYFRSRGFSDEEFQSQIKELGELITLSTFERLLKQKPPAKKLSSEEETVTYLQETFSQEEIQKVMKEEGKTLSQRYFEEVTKT